MEKQGTLKKTILFCVKRIAVYVGFLVLWVTCLWIGGSYTNFCYLYTNGFSFVSTVLFAVGNLAILIIGYRFRLYDVLVLDALYFLMGIIGALWGYVTGEMPFFFCLFLFPISFGLIFDPADFGVFWSTVIQWGIYSLFLLFPAACAVLLILLRRKAKKQRAT